MTAKNPGFGIRLPPCSSPALWWGWICLVGAVDFQSYSSQGKRAPKLSLCHRSALCAWPPGDVHLRGVQRVGGPSLPQTFCSAVDDMAGNARRYFAHVHHPQMASGFGHHFLSS